MAKDIRQICHDRGLKYVRLLIVDVLGYSRSILIKSEKFEEACYDGIGFDGSSVFGFKPIEESDLTAKPDPTTFISPHWEKPKTGVVICDVFEDDDKPFVGSPRFLLKKELEELKSRGLFFKNGVELEFFLVKRVDNTIVPFDNGFYLSDPSTDSSEGVKREIIEALESSGLVINKIHHEVAKGQHEIDFVFSDAIETADRVIYYKLATKMVASKYGLIATFMPKPFWGINGNGAHIHISLFKDDKNMFYDPEAKGNLSVLGRHFMGGLLTHARGLSIIVAPIINSYKRLTPGYEAPTYVVWGYKNRSALCRIPSSSPSRPNKVRIEYRQPDPSCNPYLAFTAILECGLDGIERKIDPGEPCQEDVYRMSHEEREQRKIKVLPTHLGEALGAFQEDPLVKDSLGDYVSQEYVRLKEEEWKDYLRVNNEWNKTSKNITSWEIDRYLFIA